MDKETEDKIDKYHEIWSFELAQIYKELIEIKKELEYKITHIYKNPSQYKMWLLLEKIKRNIPFFQLVINEYR